MSKDRLIAAVGAAAAALLTVQVPRFEGMVLRGYVDPVGVVTACAGHTKTALLGRSYTRAECEQFLTNDLAQHAQGVKACISRSMTTGQSAAFVSIAYNVGVSKFCNSTITKKFNLGDVQGACAEISRWTYAKGKLLPGLVKRRATERAMCEGNY